MSTAPDPAIVPYSHFEQLREGRAILRQEADALGALASRLDTPFCAATDLLRTCTGCVVVTGIGKAGLVGRKISATFSSTGTRSHFLHPSEALHGDLGCLGKDDVLLVLSNSGETEEICRLLPIVRGLGLRIVALTARDDSTLGREADAAVTWGPLREAGVNGLAPSTSTTVMLAVGDALALVVSRLKGFTSRDFAVFHPGGSLGRKLTLVREVMRQGGQLRIASQDATVREVLTSLSRPDRRTGAAILVASDGSLAGIFTDSDLARLLECRRNAQLDRPICEVMTARPLTVRADATLNDAIELLTARKISELPVVDEEQHPVGMIDITDVIGLVPAEPID